MPKEDEHCGSYWRKEKMEYADAGYMYSKQIASALQFPNRSRSGLEPVGNQLFSTYLTSLFFD